ncbi:ribokinase [Eubacteriales bacterium OttesenSCG-928-N13]|nr:ribokinase [Eubacteriales bacterium OttesenSCG-928-N13]
MKKLCVIGSLNTDLTIFVPRFHAPGETISGSAFHIYPGGKGGNQAVALARLGADLAMVGALGRDANGEMYQKVLEQEHIDHSLVKRANEIESGVALIEVCTQSGDNRIAIAAGANALVDIDYMDEVLPSLLGFDIFLLQLETPLDAVSYVAQKLRAAGKIVILDPAPAQPLPDELIAASSYITPNETELQLLTGMPTETDEQIKAAAQTLLARGAQAIIAKVGKRGAMLLNASGVQMAPGFKVDAVDTTAAGDSFNAGFAFALSEGMDELDALRFANAVGALSTTAAGAQAAMPSRQQVDEFMHK